MNINICRDCYYLDTKGDTVGNKVINTRYTHGNANEMIIVVTATILLLLLII
jgi:hypothetical protein